MGLLYSLSIDERKQISFNNALTKKCNRLLDLQKSYYSIMTIIDFRINMNIKNVLNLTINKIFLDFFSPIVEYVDKYFNIII